MRKMSLIVACVGLAFAAPAIAGPAADRIKAHCSGEWGNDYTMVEYCVQKQVESLLRLNDLYDETDVDNSEPHKKMLQHCLVEWQLGDESYNWDMVTYCYEKQIGAYQRLEG